MYFSKLNSLLILLVSVIAFLYALPNAVTKFNFNEISTYLPGKKVNLGLDLKGGSYILLQAEMKTSEIEFIDNTANSIRIDLRKEKIRYKGLDNNNGKITFRIRKKELIDKNHIGKLLYFRGEFSEYLPDFHPYEDYRTFYMAKKELGGGSILDQSHIMDLAYYLFGEFKSVFAFNSKVSNLEINVDDMSEMILETKNGLHGTVHTDIIGRSHKKELEIKGEKGNIFWNSTENLVTFYNAETKEKTLFKKFTTDFNLNYIDELNHFIKCCEGKETPRASLEDGIETMELILGGLPNRALAAFPLEYEYPFLQALYPAQYEGLLENI